MTEKRFILVDDEWIGLDGAGHLIAIEDSASPKKTIYFAYKVNAKGICDLLNELNDENEQLKQRVNELECLLELDKLHKEVEEGKMDKFVELKWEND